MCFYVMNSIYGFRQNRSCETQLIILWPSMILLNVLIKRATVMCYFWTFVKCLIWWHTSAYFKSYLIMEFKFVIHFCYGSNLFQVTDHKYVVLENRKSHPTEVLSAVFQGTICFNLLYSNINSVADCIALQQDLDSLVEWSHFWQMTFNPQKYEFKDH